MQNPESRRYTWRAVRNGQLKQARLDYFLVSSDVTNFVHSIETPAGYRTDHSIVMINLAFSEQQRGRGFWKFNNSLLYDSEYVSRVKKCIKETVEEYKFMETRIVQSQLGFQLTINSSLKLLNCKSEELQYHTLLEINERGLGRRNKSKKK